MSENEISLLDPKMVYEISKLTNTTKQILDDFNTSITMLMFTQFLKSFYNDTETMLDSILDKWEQIIIMQKEKELETLTNQMDSMFDMTLGAAIADSEDLDLYKKEVSAVKIMLINNLKRGIYDE